MSMETQEEQKSNAVVLFVVPKRNFKKAHDRNKLKRRLRECYRLQKQELYEYLIRQNKKLLLTLIYTSTKAEEYGTIDLAVKKILETLKKQV